MEAMGLVFIPKTGGRVGVRMREPEVRKKTKSWTLLKTSSFWLRSDSLSGMDREANRCGVSLDFSTSTSV
jgi:hypothetical protein